MRRNVGRLDQTIRYIVAIILVVVAALFQDPFWWLLIPAAILAFTAAVSWCGLYRLFGVDTCKIKQDKD